VKTSKIISSCVLAFGLLSANVAMSAQVDARVTIAGVYGNGNIYLILDAPLAQAGCTASRIDIIGTHPMAKNWLALGLTAKAGDNVVRVVSTGCFAYTFLGVNYNFPTIDTSQNGYINIRP
jgi:hypothetical protein